MITMGHILEAHMHVFDDTPVSASARPAGDGVTIQVGESMNGIRLVIWDIVDLDRLAAGIAAARAELIDMRSKVEVA